MRSGSRTNPIQNIVTGKSGENIARLLLNDIAVMTKPDEDWGIDFDCCLRERNEIEFKLQSKASKSPEYQDDQFISSLPIACSHIKEWKKFSSPTYVFMTDTRTRETYFIRADQNLHPPLNEEQKYYQFRIPLANKLQTDNLGVFVTDVIEHQREHLTQEDRKKYLDEYYQKYPYLFQNL